MVVDCDFTGAKQVESLPLTLSDLVYCLLPSDTTVRMLLLAYLRTDQGPTFIKLKAVTTKWYMFVRPLIIAGDLVFHVKGVFHFNGDYSEKCYHGFLCLLTLPVYLVVFIETRWIDVFVHVATAGQGAARYLTANVLQKLFDKSTPNRYLSEYL
ncbi:unnamed protein product [Toxocara canis]|uniref:Transmembrane protein n=1 Tax=Toxocara canis TaxID=6265 RepID=A0A183UNR2_TOXCA|nr:unnamed protein product [Toxocara canis]